MKLNQSLVLIRVDKPKEQDDSGVFIQEEWVTNQPLGTVEAVADNVKFCKVGDRVWFERYTAITHPQDENLKMCREDAVLGILDA
jgi:co-chaperonin GroES (HSP10)